jgi:hypothetical protein
MPARSPPKKSLLHWSSLPSPEFGRKGLAFQFAWNSTPRSWNASMPGFGSLRRSLLRKRSGKMLYQTASCAQAGTA